MPNIEQDFNQNVLNLIGDTGGLPSAPFDELYGDYIRLIVTDDYGNTIRTYFSNKTWTEEPVLYAHPDTPDTYDPYNIYSLNGSTVPYDQAQLPIYRDQSNLLHVKINDSFVNDPQVSYTTRNYNLRFDFLSDLFESEEIKNLGYFNPRFYITEISNSKKELRLLARHTSGNENLDLSDPDLQQAIINTFNADSGNYLLDFVLLQNGGVNNNILDFTFDSETDTENVSLIIRLYEATPFSLYDEVKLSREIYSTQNETILFIDDSSDDISVSYLDPDTDVNITSNTNQLDSLESLNELVLSSSLNLTQREFLYNQILSGSNLNINFSSLKNHTFFGSAEYKFKNFYTKVKSIEDKLNEISSSINNAYGFVYESTTASNRKKLFEQINDTISNFTPYERFMYFDTENTSSYPNAGRDYSDLPPVSGSFENDYVQISNNNTANRDWNGFDVMYETTTFGDDVVLSGSFDSSSGLVNNFHNWWNTGSTGIGTGWDITQSAASPFDGRAIWHGDLTGDNSFLRPVSQSVYDGTNGLNGSLNQPQFSFFQNNTSYLIEFDVDDFYSAGNITFVLNGEGGSEDDSTNIVTTNIAATGHYKLHFDGDGYAKPIEGYNYVKIKGGSGLSASFDNFHIRPTQDSDGRADITTDMYRAERFPFYHSDKPYYMSFFAKWSEKPTWENYNASQSIKYGENIPSGALHNTYYSEPVSTNTHGFERYVLVASQSYWRMPDIGDGLDVDLATDFEGTSSIEILSGSSVTGSYQITDGNGIFDGTNANFPYNLYAYNKNSILPSGELFRLYHVTASTNVAPALSSSFLDMKIFRQDDLFGGKPDEILAFSNLYSTSSNTVQTWYETRLQEAKDFDKQNVHSLYNNLPEYVRDTDDSKLLKKFLSLLSEVYDDLKLYIDNFDNITSREYGKDSSVPNRLLQIVGSNYGWNFINTSGLKSLLEYFIGKNNDYVYDEINKKLWKNILNNLIYIYKTKGTEQSVRALLSCFGLPSDIVSFDQIGGSDELQLSRSPGLVNLTSPAGISKQLGNISYKEKPGIFHFLNFNENNNSFKLDWNQTIATSSGVEFMFTARTGSSEQILLKSSGSGTENLWDLRLVPSGSDNYSASLELRVNASQSGSLNITGSNINQTVSMSTDYFDIKSNYENDIEWNVLVQQNSFNANTSSLTLALARKDNDTIKQYNWIANENVYLSSSLNFLGTGSLSSTTGDNLYAGYSLTGSMSDVRIWAQPLDSQSFYTHVFNPSSVVNGTGTRGFKDLISRYIFQQDLRNVSDTTLVKDVVKGNVYGDNSKTLGSNFTKPTIRRKKLKTFQFNVRKTGVDDISSTNKIIIAKKHEFHKKYLTPLQNNLSIIPGEDKFGNKERKFSYKLRIGSNPNDEINSIINNSLSDVDVGQLFGDPGSRNSSSYDDANEIFEDLMSQYTSDFNLTRWILKQEDLIPKQFWDALDNIIPARLSIDDGVNLSSPIMHRNRMDWDEPSAIIINPNQFTISESFELPKEISVDKTEYQPIFTNTEKELLSDVIDGVEASKYAYQIAEINKVNEITIESTATGSNEYKKVEIDKSNSINLEPEKASFFTVDGIQKVTSTKLTASHVTDDDYHTLTIDKVKEYNLSSSLQSDLSYHNFEIDKTSHTILSSSYTPYFTSEISRLTATKISSSVFSDTLYHKFKVDKVNVKQISGSYYDDKSYIKLDIEKVNTINVSDTNKSIFFNPVINLPEIKILSASYQDEINEIASFFYTEIHKPDNTRVSSSYMTDEGYFKSEIDKTKSTQITSSYLDDSSYHKLDIEKLNSTILSGSLHTHNNVTINKKVHYTITSSLQNQDSYYKTLLEKVNTTVLSSSYSSQDDYFNFDINKTNHTILSASHVSDKDYFKSELNKVNSTELSSSYSNDDSYHDSELNKADKYNINDTSTEIYEEITLSDKSSILFDEINGVENTNIFKEDIDIFNSHLNLTSSLARVFGLNLLRRQLASGSIASGSYPEGVIWTTKEAANGNVGTNYFIHGDFNPSIYGTEDSKFTDTASSTHFIRYHKDARVARGPNTASKYYRGNNPINFTIGEFEVVDTRKRFYYKKRVKELGKNLINSVWPRWTTLPFDPTNGKFFINRKVDEKGNKLGVTTQIFISTDGKDITYPVNHFKNYAQNDFINYLYKGYENKGDFDAVGNKITLDPGRTHYSSFSDGSPVTVSSVKVAKFRKKK